MFTVFAEKDIFETVVLFNKDYPNWFDIIKNHSKVYLNLSQDLLDIELVPGNVIYEYVNAHGGRSPEIFEAQFENVYDDPAHMVTTPRSAYFLNVSEEEAQDRRNNWGVVTQSNHGIDDNILKATYFKNLKQDDVHETKTVKGWKSLINTPLPPSNALVISDPYLFYNEDGDIGTSNILELIDAVMPPTLNIDFHLLLIAEECPNKDKAWCERKAGNLKTAISNLRRPYNVVFEIVFSKTIHARIALSNYYSIRIDKGFCVFSLPELKTVKSGNKLLLDRIFVRVKPEEGDTEFNTAEEDIKLLSNNCKSVAQYITNRPNDTNFRILGDCNKDKSLKNRLINDV